MQSRVFGVLARVDRIVYPLVCGVALAAGCSNGNENSAQSPSRGATPTGGTQLNGDQASTSSESGRTQGAGGTSNAGASRASTSEKGQTGGSRAVSSEAQAGGSRAVSSEVKAGGTKAVSSEAQAGGTKAVSSKVGSTLGNGGAEASAGGTRASTEPIRAGGARSTLPGSNPTSSVGGTQATPQSNSNRGGQASATTGTSSTTTAGADPFVLAWKDDFDSFDASTWELMTHSWDGNLAQFSKDNVSTASGILSINLTAASGDAAKPYRGVEMRSKRTLTYGKVAARIRFARGAGVVSGLVTIYTPWPADNWNEIDIEHLGKSPTSTQLNCMVYTGAPVTPPVTQSVSPTQDPLSVSLGFDAEADFHEYQIEWTPTSIKFVVDGTTLRTWTKEIARMTLPQNILFTIWASSSADWAGAMTNGNVPTSAQIDWIRVYELRK